MLLAKQMKLGENPTSDQAFFCLHLSPQSQADNLHLSLCSSILVMGLRGERVSI